MIINKSFIKDSLLTCYICIRSGQQVSEKRFIVYQFEFKNQNTQISRRKPQINSLISNRQTLTNKQVYSLQTNQLINNNNNNRKIKQSEGQINTHILQRIQQQTIDKQMNNFHFNAQSNKSIQLKKQLQLMTRDIEQSKKQLQKKNLQLEFYEDPDYVNNKQQSIGKKHVIDSQESNHSNYMNVRTGEAGYGQNSNKYDNLADQIMNDLLQDNKAKPLIRGAPKDDQHQHQYQKQFIDNPSINMYQQQNDFTSFVANQRQQKPYSNQPNLQPISQSNNHSQSHHHHYQQPFQPRQNNFLPQNKRQLDKQKLQNPSSFDSNPFLPKAQPIKRSIESRQQKPIVNERELQKLKLQQQSALNQYPFWGQNNNRNNRSMEKANQNKLPLNYQQYENIREKQKQKLQQQLHQNQDFSLYDKSTQPPQTPPQKDVQPQNIHKKAAFQNRYSNPFSKNQEQIKQLKEQQQREYRRALEEQKKMEQKRKKNEKQKAKEQKYAFNAYEPGTGGTANVPKQNDIPTKSPPVGITKKIDPNGRPPVYNYDQQSSKPSMSSSDREFMKIKANELKESFKRGRILHDEYLSQVKKLAEYYKVDFRELVDRKDLDEKDQDLPWIKDKKQQETIKGQSQMVPPQDGTERRDYQILENQQSLQKFPDSEASLKNNQYSQQHPSPSRNSPFNLYPDQLPQPPFYGQQYPVNPIPGIYTQNLPTNPSPQYGLASTSFLQQMQGVDYELMRKMFEEMKAMRSDYTKSLQKQKVFLQQTFMKFLANGMMQNQSQNQNQSQLKNQKVPQSSPRYSNNKQSNVLPLNLQQNSSDQSMEFIQKSLSGVVNKIPFYNNSANRSNINNGDQSSFMAVTPQANFGKKHTDKKEASQKNQETIEQFFSKPYKCKKFKKFSIMVDVSQSSMQIPNVSSFLALKNGKQVLNKLFEEDLLMMKKLQREKDVEKLRNRVDNQLSYGNQLLPQQTSSFQQQTFITEEVSNVQQPNYGETFNKNRNTGIFIVKAEEKKVVVSQNNNSFEEYENYSRSKERQVLSARQKNHRSYKKIDQSISIDTVLKKSNQGQEQKLPDFADQSDIKAKSPIYYSPRMGSQILEQDEYQTAQKSTNQQLLESQFYGSSVVKQQISPQQKQSTNKKYKMKKKDFAYEQERQSQKKSKSKDDEILSFKQALKQRSLQKQKQPNLGMMKMITKNNQMLKKYQVSPSNNVSDLQPRNEAVDIRQYSSIGSNVPKQDELKNYFSGGNVKDNNGSENAGYKLPKMVGSSNTYSGNGSVVGMEKKLSDKFNTQKEGVGDFYNQESIEEIKSDNDGLEEDRSEYVSSHQYPTKRSTNPGAYQASQQQTVKSINYSSTQSHNPKRPLHSFHMSQTVQSVEQSASKLIRPPLNKKKSTSKKKQSSIVRTKFEKDSILQKPPPSQSQINSIMVYSDHDRDLIVDKEPVKFDSNVYDSEYEQSVSQNLLQKRIEQLQNQQKMKISQPQINVSPPVIVNTKSSVLNIQGSESRVSSIGGSKLKSLQEARNLAKQSKKKSTNLNENDQIFKYEQKMSQLESFLTRKQQSLIKQTKESKTIKLAIQKSPPQKKNIMNLLDELQNESSYKDDFQSYRQQSQWPRY